MNLFKKNLANITTILGVLPLFLLLYPKFFQYLPLLIVYNNIMDDLDGILARELKISSKFGGNLDNLADTLAHIIILWVVMVHNGGIILLFGFFPTISILLRVANRLDDTIPNGGSPTNELIRHIFFVYLISLQFHQIDFQFLYVTIFMLHSLSLMAPFEMPLLIRQKAKSVKAIIFVNILLVIAWLVPLFTIFIAFSFLGTYFYSFCFSGLKWLRA